MAATKRNPGLTSAVPRASLNDEELVSDLCTQNLRGTKLVLLTEQRNDLWFSPSLPLFSQTENARLQENSTGAHLPDLQHYTAQLSAMDGHLTDLLLRMRGFGEFLFLSGHSINQTKLINLILSLSRLLSRSLSFFGRFCSCGA